MSLAATFATWKAGVLVGLGAPDNAITTDALWAWQSAEGGIGHNNPLNTTYFMAGAVPWNTLPNGLHVWSYLTIGDGINATVVTLLAPDASVGLPNGYDVIVGHLRRAIPRSQWGDACWQLAKWGTGCSWLTTDYGAAPGSATGDDMQVIVYRNPVDGSEWQVDPAFTVKAPITAARATLLDQFAKLLGQPGLTVIDNANAQLDQLPVVTSLAPYAGGGGSAPTPEPPEPSEPAEPKTVTLNIPAQTITGTLA